MGKRDWGSENEKGIKQVVICFQNCIFDISKTTLNVSEVQGKRLWFAFKIVSLTYRKQLVRKFLCLSLGCDLLSKLYLWHIENNKAENVRKAIEVVICFQNCIFDISKTTRYRSYSTHLLLWFAFKIVSLTYRKQQSGECPQSNRGCDLLSKLYLWHIENNAKPFLLLMLVVVICFQNCIFDISKTTRTFSLIALPSLWFAFKIVSLTYRKQLIIIHFRGLIRCDLLSKLYLWHIENNGRLSRNCSWVVVICFQNCIFDISKTTDVIDTHSTF